MRTSGTAIPIPIFAGVSRRGHELDGWVAVEADGDGDAEVCDGLGIVTFRLPKRPFVALIVTVG